jgi:hypothetical protein
MRHSGLYSLEGTNHFNIARGGTPFSATAGLDASATATPSTHGGVPSEVISLSYLVRRLRWVKSLSYGGKRELSKACEQRT